MFSNIRSLAKTKKTENASPKPFVDSLSTARARAMHDLQKKRDMEALNCKEEEDRETQVVREAVVLAEEESKFRVEREGQVVEVPLGSLLRSRLTFLDLRLLSLIEFTYNEAKEFNLLIPPLVTFGTAEEQRNLFLLPQVQEKLVEREDRKRPREKEDYFTKFDSKGNNDLWSRLVELPQEARTLLASLFELTGSVLHEVRNAASPSVVGIEALTPLIDAQWSEHVCANPGLPSLRRRCHLVYAVIDRLARMGTATCFDPNEVIPAIEEPESDGKGGWKHVKQTLADQITAANTLTLIALLLERDALLEEIIGYQHRYAMMLAVDKPESFRCPLVQIGNLAAGVGAKLKNGQLCSKDYETFVTLLCDPSAFSDSYNFPHALANNGLVDIDREGIIGSLLEPQQYLSGFYQVAICAARGDMRARLELILNTIPQGLLPLLQAGVECDVHTMRAACDETLSLQGMHASTTHTNFPGLLLISIPTCSVFSTTEMIDKLLFSSSYPPNLSYTLHTIARHLLLVMKTCSEDKSLKDKKDMLQRDAAVSDLSSAEHAYLFTAMGDTNMRFGISGITLHMRRSLEKLDSKVVKHIMNNTRVEKGMFAIRRIMGWVSKNSKMILDL